MEGKILNINVKGENFEVNYFLSPRIDTSMSESNEEQ